MNFNSPGISYIFLVIPALLAFAVLSQGFSKLAHKEPDANIALGFGVLLFILIIAAYWMFIR